MLNECGQLWASRAAQALDARLTNHVVDPSVNPALDASLCPTVLTIGTVAPPKALLWSGKSNINSILIEIGDNNELEINYL